MELFSQPILNSIKLPVHVKGKESKLIENKPASAANSELVCLVIINVMFTGHMNCLSKLSTFYSWILFVFLKIIFT